MQTFLKLEEAEVHSVAVAEEVLLHLEAAHPPMALRIQPTLFLELSAPVFLTIAAEAVAVAGARAELPHAECRQVLKDFSLKTQK